MQRKALSPKPNVSVHNGESFVQFCADIGETANWAADRFGSELCILHCMVGILEEFLQEREAMRCYSLEHERKRMAESPE